MAVHKVKGVLLIFIINPLHIVNVDTMTLDSKYKYIFVHGKYKIPHPSPYMSKDV